MAKSKIKVVFDIERDRLEDILQAAANTGKNLLGITDQLDGNYTAAFEVPGGAVKPRVGRPAGGRSRAG